MQAVQPMLEDRIVALTYAVGVRTLWGTKQMPHMVICEKSSQLVTAKLAALVREEDAGQRAKTRIRKFQEA